MPKSLENYQPSQEEIQKIEESRATSDTQAVREGAEIKAGGHIEFTKKQIKDVRERMVRELTPYFTIWNTFRKLDDLEQEIICVQEKIDDNYMYRTNRIDIYESEKKRLLEDIEGKRKPLLDIINETWPRLEYSLTDFQEGLGSLRSQEEQWNKLYTEELAKYNESQIKVYPPYTNSDRVRIGITANCVRDAQRQTRIQEKFIERFKKWAQ